jgi:hypothetical protein
VRRGGSSADVLAPDAVRLPRAWYRLLHAVACAGFASACRRSRVQPKRGAKHAVNAVSFREQPCNARAPTAVGIADVIPAVASAVSERASSRRCRPAGQHRWCRQPYALALALARRDGTEPVGRDGFHLPGEGTRDIHGNERRRRVWRRSASGERFSPKLSCVFHARGRTRSGGAGVGRGQHRLARKRYGLASRYEANRTSLCTARCLLSLASVPRSVPTTRGSKTGHAVVRGHVRVASARVLQPIDSLRSHAGACRRRHRSPVT